MLDRPAAVGSCCKLGLAADDVQDPVLYSLKATWAVEFPGGPFAFVCERAHLHHSDCVVLSANREALPMTDNQDTYTGTAPLWVVLLGLIIAIEIGALPVTRAMLAAVLP